MEILAKIVYNIICNMFSCLALKAYFLWAAILIKKSKLKGDEIKKLLRALKKIPLSKDLVVVLLRRKNGVNQ